LIDDMSRYLRTLPTERAAAVLPRATPALTKIFPVLGRLAAVQTIKQRHALPNDPAEIRRLGQAALRDLLGNIAAQERLVVFVDDVQWSDLDGARLLASLVPQAAEPDAPAMLLIIAHRARDAEQAPGLATLLERLASSPDLRAKRLQLPALSRAASRELAVRLLERPGSGIEDRIALEARGNPLFIRQLCRHVGASENRASSLSLDDVLTRRIADLAPQERETLAAICLTPRPVSLDLLARILNQPDPEPWARNLELAQLARFVPGTPDAVTAFHDRIRDVVVSGTDTAHRRRLHARSVEALERTADPDLVALTLHYLGCDRGRDAAGCAVRAARRAASVLAFEQAAAMYRLALELGRWSDPERVDLRVRLAEALVFDHRSGEAGTQFVEAAFEKLREATRWFDRSALGHVPFLICHCHWMWARAALACAQEMRPGQRRREELLQQAEASIAMVSAFSVVDGTVIEVFEGLPISVSQRV
jgi:predicted ATPase